MSDVHVPKTCEGVDVFLVVAVENPAALASSQHQWPALRMLMQVRDRVQHVVDVHLDEGRGIEGCACHRSLLSHSQQLAKRAVGFGATRIARNRRVGGNLGSIGNARCRASTGWWSLMRFTINRHDMRIGGVPSGIRQCNAITILMCQPFGGCCPDDP